MMKKLNVLKFSYPQFKNIQEEADFNNELYEIQRSFFKKLLIIVLFLDLLIAIINPFDQERASLAYISSTSIIILATLFLRCLVNNKHIYAPLIALNLLIAIHVVWVTENFIQAGSHEVSFQYMICGALYQTLQTIMLLCHSKLKFFFPMLISINVYSYFRIRRPPHLAFDIAIYYHVLFILVNTLMCWKIEIEAIQQYTRRRKAQEIQLNFKNIVDEFPSAFLITKNEKVVYANKFCQKYSDPLNPKSSQLKGAEEIEVMMRTQSLREYPKGRESLLSEESSEPLLKSAENFVENTNFNEILKSFRNSQQENKSLLLNTCFGRLPSSGEAVQYLECKFFEIAWEGERAQMISIAESQIFEKYIESRRENERKDKLIANVCHDLRTPLNGMMGLLNLIEEMSPEKEIINLTEMAKHSAKHLLFIINDLLDSSQIANGKLRLNFENFKLEECVRSVVEFLKFQAHDRNIDVTFINKVHSECIVKSDPNRFKQVLINLVGNAIKFTEKGKVEVIIEIDKKITRNLLHNSRDSLITEKYYIIRVIDTGCGISKHDASNLFNDFITVNNEVTRKLNKHGIGLGLSISQKIVEALNSYRKDAKIKVNSTPGRGSEFYFPLYSWEDELNKSIMKEEYTGLSTFEIEHSKKELFIGTIKSQTFSFLPNSFCHHDKKKRILIVDDDQINLIVLSHYLRKWDNVHIDKCCDGLSAINTIKSFAEEKVYFDAVIIDNKMPIMDGIEATREIKKFILEGLIPNIPIIGASGDLYSVDEFKKAGADDHISKPFSYVDLTLILNKFIRNQRIGSD